MRKIVVAAFVSLDGVLQAPGAPEEDPSGGFVHGGWLVPFFDDVLGAVQKKAFSAPFDLLLGRRTYDIFAAHWPEIAAGKGGPDVDEGSLEIARRFDAVTKYVATHRPESLAWQNSRGLGADVVGTLRELRKGDGPILLTQGSSELVHLLVDELRVMTFPVTLGKGKRLFDADTAASTLELVESTVSKTGVLVATYARVGPVKTGSYALEEPTPAELERRKKVAAER